MIVNGYKVVMNVVKNGDSKHGEAVVINILK